MLQLLFAPLAIAKTKKQIQQKVDLKQLVLPSEVSSLGKRAGSIYYSPSVKGKVLIPVHFWGEVARSGLHYIPVGTTLVNGLSLAGGPKNEGDLEEVKLTRQNGSTIDEQEFDLSKGGSILAYKTELLAGDTVFIPRDTFREDRVYYTSLVGVIATILSSILLYRQVKN
jgi:hypothetical protein